MSISSLILNDSYIAILKKKVANSDEKAFRQLYEFYYTRLADFAFVFVKNKETSLEIVDDVFIKIWKQREQIESIENLRAYLYSAVKNSSLNNLKKIAKDLITEPFDHINFDFKESIDPEKQMIGNEMLKLINEAVDSLPPKCKMIFRLVRQDNLKYREVASILNIAENTVSAQMVIAVKRISEKLSAFMHLPLSSLNKKK